MSESLRDQLLKSGLSQALKPAPRPQQPPRPPQPQRPPQQQQRPQQNDRSRPPQTPRPQNPHASRQQGERRDQGEIDLARAYALRDKTEREAREREQREAEQRSREKKERRQKLATLVNGKAMNDAAADIARHFPHGSKIRRAYVTADQLVQLNAGELALVQFSGRYLLVTRETGLAAQAIDADALVLLCDPNATDDDGVPADLVW